jgi:hypothetical protein
MFHVVAVLAGLLCIALLACQEHPDQPERAEQQEHQDQSDQPEELAQPEPLTRAAESPEVVSRAWSRQIGTSQTDHCTAVATDAVGNCYVAGHSSGVIVSGWRRGGQITHDAFIIKYDRDGRELWRRQFGTQLDDRPRAVVAADDGQTVVALAVTDIRSALTGDGDLADVLLVSFDAAGEELWRRHLASPKPDMAYGLAGDGAGGVVVVGSTDASLAGPWAGGADGFAVRCDAAGAIVWQLQFGSEKEDAARSASLTKSGLCYIVGTTGGTIEGQYAGGRFDPFIIALDEDGQEMWRRQPGTPEDDLAVHVASDGPDGGVVLGTVGWTIFPAPVDDASSFVAALGPAGAVGPRLPLASTWSNLGLVLRVDSRGNRIVLSEICRRTSSKFKEREEDSLIACFGPGGRQLWERRLGTGAITEATDIAVTDDGRCYVVGYTAVDFAGRHQGKEDGFLLAIDCPGSGETGD